MGVFCLAFLSRMANFKPLRLFMLALQLLFFFFYNFCYSWRLGKCRDGYMEITSKTLKVGKSKPDRTKNSTSC